MTDKQVPLLTAEVMKLAECPLPKRGDWFIPMWWTPKSGWRLEDVRGYTLEGAEKKVAQLANLYANRQHFRIIKIPGEGA